MPTTQNKGNDRPRCRGGRTRERRKRRAEPLWEDDFDPEKARKRDLPTKADVIRKITGEIVNIYSSEGMKRLRDFRDEQHLFSEGDRAEVLKVTRNLIDRLNAIAESIQGPDAER